MTEWTVDNQGNHVFGAEGGAFSIRVLAAPQDQRYRKTETLESSGKWDSDLGYHYRSLDEAKADVEDRYHHAVELRSLPRQRDSLMKEQKRTPWGLADGMMVYGDGIVRYYTPGHGGIHVDRKRNAKIHPALREACGDGAWYEEDCGWSAVAFTHQELFTSREVRHATETLKNRYPHAYTAATGQTVELSESLMLREEEHTRRHAMDWQVISAIYDKENPGMTRVTATIGGRRSTFDATVTEKLFLVPNAEYAARSTELSFVVDPSRHQEIGLPPIPAP
jgi:hypothetical protein